ncbi:MAG: ribD [Panacagrimonas sp.]|jgi:diaminohydroxyphosphoribosylaminopyrimidine deaminase/5-amino-6-(5-phosphoribosylamino)uracil reductase|nr:bifunctional diaminohydroxyphosphoribosylaminopyrimidine deaminase/5-amino-6-(5-phosphoribosylamino)uracil reductase RibD [Panacagrimonas sp.]MCC2658629.1 ribD [Panacagrimonas sp.]
MSQGGAAEYMAQALRLAERGRFGTFPNPRVGCVIVREGEVVGRGWHERAGQPHAEIIALREAGDRARGADLYVTLEPCSHHGRTPPCADAVVAAGPRRVVAAMSDPNPRVAGKGFERLRGAGIEVDVGLLEAAARELNGGFVSRMTRGRPWVTLKLAASLDGRTAMASGESRWITSPAARRDVHRLRAEAGAVLTGAGTVVADDPQLNVRDIDGAWRAPDRIVLDGNGRVPGASRVWNAADGARRFRVGGTTTGAPPEGVARVDVALASDGRVDLSAALRALAQHEVNHVLVECGSVLAGALLDAGLVDELVCYLAPCLLGDAARALAEVPGLQRLEQRVRLRFTDVRSVGPDLRITAIPQPRSA